MIPDEFVGLGRPPGALLVGVDSDDVIENRVHDPPGRLDGILSREQLGVALDRVAEEPLVGRHLVHVSGLDHQLDRLADHLLARHLRQGAQGDDLMGLTRNRT